MCSRVLCNQSLAYFQQKESISSCFRYILWDILRILLPFSVTHTYEVSISFSFLRTKYRLINRITQSFLFSQRMSPRTLQGFIFSICVCTIVSDISVGQTCFCYSNCKFMHHKLNIHTFFIIHRSQNVSGLFSSIELVQFENHTQSHDPVNC